MYLFELPLIINFDFYEIDFVMFIMLHHSFIDRFPNLPIKPNPHFYHQMGSRDQSPFITHIKLSFSIIHLKIPSFSLKLSFDVTNIKLFQDKIHFKLFSHLFHKVYSKVLSLGKK